MEGVRVGVVVHDLKTWPEYFEATWSGRKPWELRKNDRGYQPGQVLRLREWEPLRQAYTGRVIVADVVYVLFGGVFGLPEDYCIMTLSEVTRMVDSL